jgi:hypothetical protein
MVGYSSRGPSNRPCPGRAGDPSTRQTSNRIRRTFTPHHHHINMAEMEIDTGDGILEKAALDGSMDYSAWPELLHTVLSRIEKVSLPRRPISDLAGLRCSCPI